MAKCEKLKASWKIIAEWSFNRIYSKLLLPSILGNVVLNSLRAVTLSEIWEINGNLQTSQMFFLPSNLCNAKLSERSQAYVRTMDWLWKTSQRHDRQSCTKRNYYCGNEWQIQTSLLEATKRRTFHRSIQLIKFAPNKHNGFHSDRTS